MANIAINFSIRRVAENSLITPVDSGYWGEVAVGYFDSDRTGAILKAVTFFASHRIVAKRRVCYFFTSNTEVVKNIF